MSFDPDDINPFVPSFGVSPPVLAGRERMLHDFARALHHGVGQKERSILFTGARGTGKTVMLNEIQAVATASGWQILDDTASPGLLDRLVKEQLPDRLRQLDPDATTWRVKGAGGFGVSSDWETTDHYPEHPGLRRQLETLVRLADTQRPGAGVLITIDEVHGEGAREELRAVGNTFQHCRRDGLNVAFGAAGLPHAVNDLLNDDVLTFLRRSARYELSNVHPDDTRYALEQPLLDTERQISAEALDLAAVASHGYPFLIQCVGSELWFSIPRGGTIDLARAETSARRAVQDMRRIIHEPTLADITPVDRAFLAAMAVDDGPSHIEDIAERMAVTTNYAGRYRLRLLAAEIIEPGDLGYVTFSVPFMREYLREQQYEANVPSISRRRGPTRPELDL